MASSNPAADVADPDDWEDVSNEEANPCQDTGNSVVSTIEEPVAISEDWEKISHIDHRSWVRVRKSIEPEVDDDEVITTFSDNEESAGQRCRIVAMKYKMAKPQVIPPRKTRPTTIARTPSTTILEIKIPESASDRRQPVVGGGPPLPAEPSTRPPPPPYDTVDPQYALADRIGESSKTAEAEQILRSMRVSAQGSLCAKHDAYRHDALTNPRWGAPIHTGPSPKVNNNEEFDRYLMNLPLEDCDLDAMPPGQWERHYRDRWLGTRSEPPQQRN